MKFRASIVACVVIGFSSVSGQETQTVPVGAGSYLQGEPPRGLKLPPREISVVGSTRKDGARQKMPTNDWWSSLAWERFSSPQFPHPLAVQATEKGLRVSYPGIRKNVSAKHIIAPITDDLFLGVRDVEVFDDAKVEGFSDWFVTARFAAKSGAMTVTYGHGSPFVYARFQKGSGARVRTGHRVEIWHGDAESPTLGITVGGAHYGLFAPTGSRWTRLEDLLLESDGKGGDYFSLALLPDKSVDLLKLFAKHAHAHVVDSRADWRYDAASSTVETTFRYKTVALEGDSVETLFALYPHQWSTAGSLETKSSYASVRGEMRLSKGRGFRTRMRFPGILPALPLSPKADKARLGADIKAAITRGFKKIDDTYWNGKVLGQLASLLPIAEQIGAKESAEYLQAELRGRVEDWLEASSGESAHLFFYDELWGTLIGHHASYGSDRELNDHHFHYAYLIRAAAEVARRDPTWAKRWGGMVSLLARDIASPDRDDALFPHMRCFDVYAGHSWASGHARFGDGNNQESTSEAMNAWTALALWGDAIGDEKWRDLGIALYTNELYAANEYWFDVHERTQPESYSPTCAALIWGGKTDYATWFSGEPEHIHGIVLLPIQSGSLYLGLYPEYVQRNLADLAERRGSYEWKHWPEVFWSYEALIDPGRALARFEKGCTKLAPETRAIAYHWITSLQDLGLVDRSVSASDPFAIAFRQTRGPRYVGAASVRGRTVRFSDGKKLAVPAGKLTVSD